MIRKIRRNEIPDCVDNRNRSVIKLSFLFAKYIKCLLLANPTNLNGKGGNLL